MALAPDTHLAYEILAPVGVGGTGEVLLGFKSRWKMPCLCPFSNVCRSAFVGPCVSRCRQIL